MKTIHFPLAILALLLFSSCITIRPGEVGVKQTLGRISDQALTEGPRGFNPFVSNITLLPTRTVNMEIRSNLPSKEGLTIDSEISILYRIRPTDAPMILRELGKLYEREVIMPVFRSASADVTSRFLAKDMHSGERLQIETAIRDRMAEVLDPRGIIIENVLMKNISLPAGLSRSIEEKLQAEQEAQRMEFIKQKEQFDAERRIIEAQGVREAALIAADAERQRLELQARGQAAAIRLEAEAQAEANQRLQESLSDMVLRNRAIEAFMRIASQENTKMLITNGDYPFLGLPADLLRE
jgi:regulator of protease activity HflC (stomatin/prohibitin superfamily)